MAHLASSECCLNHVLNLMFNFRNTICKPIGTNLHTFSKDSLKVLLCLEESRCYNFDF